MAVIYIINDLDPEPIRSCDLARTQLREDDLSGFNS
jgi:hypothetical protein